jgi:hypothetical protein
MTTEAEIVRDALSVATGAPFKIAEPSPSRGLVRKQSVWFVTFADLAYVNQTGHLSTAWKDKKGGIWFETSEIWDMIALVERLYGEKGAASMPDPAIGELPDQSMPKEVAGFSRVVELLKKYAQVLSEVEKRRGLNLRLLYDGGSGLTTVRIATAASFDPHDESEAREVVERVSGVLREAYDLVLEAGST